MDTKEFKLGWTPDRPDSRDHTYSAPFNFLSKLPVRVDLSEQSPWWFNQGKEGSCTANAVLSMFGFVKDKQRRENADPDPLTILSRQFLYYNTRKREGNESFDSGATIRTTMSMLNKLGACPEELWPYIESNMFQKPSKEAYAAALDWQSVRYSRIWQHERLIKGCLAEGYPVAFGFSVRESFYDVNSTGLYYPKGRTLGGHAVLLVAYDDDFNGTGQKWVGVQNSWGREFGKKGMFWMPTSNLTDLGVASDFWTLKMVE